MLWSSNAEKVPFEVDPSGNECCKKYHVKYNNTVLKRVYNLCVNSVEMVNMN